MTRGRKFRPAGQHIRLAERAAYDAGARNVEWDNGAKHWRMRVTMPEGKTVLYAISRRMTAITAANLPDWIVQRIRREAKKKERAR